MAYNTRRLKTDLDQKPGPQVYNPVTDEFEALLGSEAGGNRVQLYDGDGNPVAAATETTLEAARLLLASLDGKDYATAAKQDAAKGVLDTISTAVAARATEATLAQIKTALTDGSLKAQLSGRKAPLVKSYNNANHMLSNANMWYGETTVNDSAAVVPLDGAVYRDKAILFRNNYNVQITVKLYAFTGAQAGSGLYPIDLATVPAGASQWFTVKEYPVLTVPLPGWGIYLYTGATEKTGTHSLYMFGGV